MDLIKLYSDTTTSFLLMGGGVEMKSDALDFARAFLHVNNLSLHQDFYLFGDGDKKVLGVEDIPPVIEKASFPPAIAEKNLIVLNGMERLTKAAQNKLLLLLENNPYTFFLGICYEDILLPTVKSRMRKVIYPVISKEYFLKHHNLSSKEQYLYYACEGNEAIYGHIQKYRSLFEELFLACSQEDERYKLLQILHLVKEKDKEAISNDKILRKAVICALASIFQENATKAYLKRETQKAIRYLETVNALLEAQIVCGNPDYTKDDFFSLMVFCMEH